MRSRIQSIHRYPGILALALLLALPVSVQAQKKADQAAGGWLGVSIQDVTEDLSEALPRGVREGALVNNVVEDSPAEKAGLVEGDVIVKVNQTRIRNSGDLTGAIRDAGAGEKVLIEYYREGRRMRVDVELAARSQRVDVIVPERERKHTGSHFIWNEREDDEENDSDHEDLYFFDEHKGPYALALSMLDRGPRLGVHLMDLNDQLASYFKVSGDRGPLVTEVIDDSPASAAGLQAGDIILRVGDERVEDADQVRKTLRQYDEGGDVPVEIVRSGRRQTVSVRLEKVEKPPMERLFMPRVRSLSAPDYDGWDREELDKAMEELRLELKELKRELSELRTKIR